MDSPTSSSSAQGRARRLQELLAVPPRDDAEEELPAIADADPYGEMVSSRSLYIQSPRGLYVRRPWLDEVLDAALRERDIVLLSGESESGKWQTAFEAVRRTLPSARLLVPRPGMIALAELLSLNPPLRAGADPVVVWLDGLERYLGTDNGIDIQMMDRLRSLAPRVVILASVHDDVRAHLLSIQGHLGPVARLVLGQAATIVVPDGLIGQERAGAERMDLGEGSRRGTSAQISGTPVLERGYRADRAEQDNDGRADRLGRIGAAVVQAAADWRRMGMSRSVTERELRELTTCYLSPDRQRQVSVLDDAQWSAALQWALTVPPGVSAPLLQEVPSPSPAQGPGEPTARTFRPIGFLGDARSDSGIEPSDRPDIPAAAWEFVLRQCDPFELMIIAEVADKDADPAMAEAAWRKATLSLDPSAASMAWLRLAGRLDERGDRSEAIAAYQQCIANGERAVPGFLAERRSDGTGRDHDIGRGRTRACLKGEVRAIH